MRKTTHNILYPLLLWVCLMLSLFAAGTAGNKELHAAAAHVPRGIAGLELGMTPEQVGQLFAIKEDIDPVAALLTKYGKSEAGEAVSRQNKALKKRFPIFIKLKREKKSPLLESNVLITKKKFLMRCENWVMKLFP